MDGTDFFNAVKQGLIVSCQALENEPLHGGDTMGKMAKAAEEGGAVAIRANGVSDILEMKKKTKLPIIGLIKMEYKDSEVYITPTKREVDLLLNAGVAMIALDATMRERPGGERLEELIDYIQSKNVLVMADISTYEEGYRAMKLGVHCVSTTLSGYTAYSRQLTSPDFELIRELSQVLNIPVIGEGRIHTPEEAKRALELGAHTVVVGSAISRPQLITQRFVNLLKKEKKWDDNQNAAFNNKAY